MKKLLLSTVVAVSSVFTLTACTSVNATTDTALPTTKQQHYKADLKQDFMRGPMSQLDLTAAQQAQIKALMQAHRDDRKAERANHKAARVQTHQHVHALANASSLDTVAVNRLADQQAAKTKARFIERVQTQHAIAQVLTAEQREKLAKLQAEKMAKGHHDSAHHSLRGKPRQYQGM